jgi:hypothetical protein
MFWCDTKVRLKKFEQQNGNRRHNFENYTTEGAGDQRTFRRQLIKKLRKRKEKLKEMTLRWKETSREKQGWQQEKGKIHSSKSLIHNKSCK